MFIIYGRYNENATYTDNFMWDLSEAKEYVNKIACENEHKNVIQYEVHDSDGLQYAVRAGECK